MFGKADLWEEYEEENNQHNNTVNMPLGGLKTLTEDRMFRRNAACMVIWS